MCSIGVHVYYRVLVVRGGRGCHFAAFTNVAAPIGLTCANWPLAIDLPIHISAPIATYTTMLRNLRPLLSKGASTSRRSLASTPVRALATPAIEGRSSPVRSHSVEE
jgi:hypothetical protein